MLSSGKGERSQKPSSGLEEWRGTKRKGWELRGPKAGLQAGPKGSAVAGGRELVGAQGRRGKATVALQVVYLDQTVTAT